MKPIQNLVAIAALVLSSSTALAAHAAAGAQDITEAATPASTPVSTPASAPAAAPMSHGEIRKVDKEAGKLTIKHGPLDNLGMGAMTMVFRVNDPAMLDQLKAGDKISFFADMVNGQLTVMQVEVKAGE
jgi:Cu/Ag efflux protein CusF